MKQIQILFPSFFVMKVQQEATNTAASSKKHCLLWFCRDTKCFSSGLSFPGYYFLDAGKIDRKKERKKYHRERKIDSLLLHERKFNSQSRVVLQLVDRMVPIDNQVPALHYQYYSKYKFRSHCTGMS